MKGASLNIGAAQLAAVSKKIEELSEQMDAEQLQPLIAELEVVMNTTTEALQLIVQKLTAQQSSH